MEKCINKASMKEHAQNIQKLSVAEVFATLETRPQGLTQAEAEARLKKFGKNKIQKIKGKPILLKFLSNFTHLMAILLWVGGIVAWIAQMPQLTIAVFLVIFLNGTFSFWQEYHAEKATEALQKLLPSYVRVLRDAQEQRILAEDLVIGDVLLLSEGDSISADARLVGENDFRVNQSTLTGESHPVHKGRDASLREDLTRAEQPSLIFAGTSTAAGTGKAVVFATGMDTEFGKIAKLTQSMKEEPSPMQKEMGRVTKIVSAMAVGIGSFFFVLAMLLAKVSFAESFIFGMGMIVAFVPEGLLPTVTLALAMGVQRMAKRNALVKRMSAVETLGCTTVICTDKTGTLTQNEMTVSGLWIAGRRIEVTGVGYAPEGGILEKGAPVGADADVRRLLTAAGLCSNARLLPPEGETAGWSILGDPTEAALLVAARKARIDLEEEEKQTPRLRELPFDSGRKRMSTIHGGRNPRIAYVKGAPKEILDLCTHTLRDGQAVLLDEALRETIMEANDRYARDGLRVLAVAMRDLQTVPALPRRLSEYTPTLIETDMTFLGLVAMADPPRAEVAGAVEKCTHAGIRIIMITGDYGLTAESIARRIGIVHEAHARIITGVELEGMPAEDLKKALQGEVIFARVAPEQKLRVVSSLQEMGHIVAVTGDGVNDAPALKKADIGIAMGLSGTDVAKEAAAMILTDDNFASIVNAVEEGRTVYDNTRKFFTYILNSNMPEAVPYIFFLFSRGAIPLPLTVMQILAIDLGTDVVPAMALGQEKPEAGVMARPPRSPKEPLLNRRFLVRTFLWYGMIESVVAMGAYFFLNYLYGWPQVPLASTGTIYRMASTMTLAATVFCQIGLVFNSRTERASVFSVGFFSNRLIFAGILCEVALLCLLMYVPALHTFFNTAPLGLREWAFLVAWPPVIILIDELRKACIRKREKHERTRKA